MAVKLQFINIIIPVRLMIEKLGQQVFEDKFNANLDFMWNDGKLYREGCMNEINLRDDLEAWESDGFELFEVIDGRKYWKDVCVVYSGHGPSYPCHWIAYNREKNIAWLKGTEPGEAVGTLVSR